MNSKMNSSAAKPNTGRDGSGTSNSGAGSSGGPTALDNYIARMEALSWVPEIETREIRDLNVNTPYEFIRVNAVHTCYGRALLATMRASGDLTPFRVFLPEWLELPSQEAVDEFFRIMAGFKIEGFSASFVPKLQFFPYPKEVPRNE